MTMKKILRFVCVLLCTLLLFAAVGCDEKAPAVPGSGGEGGGNTPPTEEVKPVTTDDFLIGSWVSYYGNGSNIKSMSEQTKQLSEAGINFLPAGGWIPGYGETVERDLGSLAWWKHVDDVMRENNIVYFMTSDASDPTTHASIPNAVPNMSKAGYDNAKKMMSALKNCVGYQIWDEPQKKALAEIGEWCKQYALIKKGVYPFVNLLPSYAGYNGTVVYTDYVETWIKSVGAKNIEYLSHDYYCMTKAGTALSIFGDMEIMRSLGLKYGIKTHAFPQACGWGDMRCPNADEVRWNVYAYIAYGFKALSYFNYAMWIDEGCFDAPISLQGEIKDQAKYDALKKMNWEIRATSDIIMSLDCMHAYHAGGAGLDGVELLPSDFALRPKSGANVIISDMRSRTGGDDYFMVFNKSFDAEVKDMTFTLDQSSGISSLELWDPSAKTHTPIELTNNTFKLSLEKGEGKFIRIVK